MRLGDSISKPLQECPHAHHLKDKVIPRLSFVNKAQQVVQLELPVGHERVALDDERDVLADIKSN